MAYHTRITVTYIIATRNSLIEMTAMIGAAFKIRTDFIAYSRVVTCGITSHPVEGGIFHAQMPNGTIGVNGAIGGQRIVDALSKGIAEICTKSQAIVIFCTGCPAYMLIGIAYLPHRTIAITGTGAYSTVGNTLSRFIAHKARPEGNITIGIILTGLQTLLKQTVTCQSQGAVHIGLTGITEGFRSNTACIAAAHKIIGILAAFRVCRAWRLTGTTVHGKHTYVSGGAIGIHSTGLYKRSTGNATECTVTYKAGFQRFTVCICGTGISTHTAGSINVTYFSRQAIDV